MSRPDGDFFTFAAVLALLIVCMVVGDALTAPEKGKTQRTAIRAAAVVKALDSGDYTPEQRVRLVESLATEAVSTSD